MQLLELTLSTPEENLALDEALLLNASSGETLRLWESPKPFIVLGRSSPAKEEVEVDACEGEQIPILRRVSGGATILTGPGCLMYAATLDIAHRPELMDLGAIHRFVLERVAAAIKRLEPTVAVSGTSDLAVLREGIAMKFSGNSLRRVRDRVLYHGTLLYDFDLSLIARLLKTAPRQPEYREGRAHQEFVTNLDCTAQELRDALIDVWEADPLLADRDLVKQTEQLVASKYATQEWNLAR